MIETIRIQNYKCLRDVTVDLGPFNVLIGPNDSGKTSFLEALQLPNRQHLDRDLGSRVWENQVNLPVVLQINGNSAGPFEYQIQMKPTGGVFPERLSTPDFIEFQIVEGDPQPVFAIRNNARFQKVPGRANIFGISSEATGKVVPEIISSVANLLRSSCIYCLDPRAMRSPSIPADGRHLEGNGKNLATVLDALMRGADRKATINLEARLLSNFPTLRGVSTPLAGTSPVKCEVKFTLATSAKKPITIPAQQASDGAVLLIGYLVLAYGESPDILLIEEPENGLHPSRLENVISLLRQMSIGDIGDRARQIVLTTHSPLLLNYAEPEEIRIFRRHEEAGTVVTKMSDVPDIKQLRKEYASGELWYLFGEEQLVVSPKT